MDCMCFQIQQTIYLDFDTVPTGLELSLDEAILQMPMRVLSWEKHNLRMIAPDQGNYKFQSWSHGGDRQQILVVPANTPEALTTYTATYAFDPNVTTTTTVAATTTRDPEKSFQCSDFIGRVDFRRMCFSTDPCCETVMGDSSYCWSIYDNMIFPGDMIREACLKCCPNKVIGDPSPPLPGVPQTIKCSDLSRFGGVDRHCRLCCQEPETTARQCIDARRELSSNEWKQSCVSISC